MLEEKVKCLIISGDVSLFLLRVAVGFKSEVGETIETMRNNTLFLCRMALVAA